MEALHMELYAAAFIIWYTRCEEHIEYIDILKCLY